MPIKLEKVSHTYERHGARNIKVLDNVEFELNCGEIVALMGPASSGKSTLLNILAGFIKPETGAVLLDGEDINAKKYDRTKLRRTLAYLPSGASSMLFESTVERELSYMLRMLGIHAEERSARIRDLLELFGMDSNAICAISPLRLSRTEKYKIALASLLAAEPDYILIDSCELIPERGSSRPIMEALKQLSSRGSAVLLVTNDADTVSMYADRAIMLDGGRIARSGDARTLMSEYYELIRHGIEAPCTRELIQLLRERGVNIPGNIIDYDQLLDRLKIIMWRKSE